MRLSVWSLFDPRFALFICLSHLPLHPPDTFSSSMWMSSEQDLLFTSPNEESGPLANNAPLTKKQRIKIAKYHEIVKKRWRLQNKEWYGKTQSRRQQPAGADGGQSSHDVLNNSQFQGKWKEISAKIDALGTTVKEKTNTSHSTVAQWRWPDHRHCRYSYDVFVVRKVLRQLFLQTVSFVGSVTGSPPNSGGKQLGQARMDALYSSRPVLSTSLRSEDDLVSVSERVQQQTVEVPMPQILRETVEVDKLASFERVQQQSVDVLMVNATDVERESRWLNTWRPHQPSRIQRLVQCVEHVSSTLDWCHLIGTSASDSTRRAWICRHLYSAYSGDRTCLFHTWCFLCNTCASDWIRGARTYRYSYSTGFCDWWRDACICYTSSCDWFCGALFCDRAHRTGNFSDPCYHQWTVSLAYTMTTVTTGVSFDTTGVVSTRCSTTVVPQFGNFGFDKYGNSCEVIRIGTGINYIDHFRGVRALDSTLWLRRCQRRQLWPWTVYVWTRATAICRSADASDFEGGSRGRIHREADGRHFSRTEKLQSSIWLVALMSLKGSALKWECNIWWFTSWRTGWRRWAARTVPCLASTISTATSMQTHCSKDVSHNNEAGELDDDSCLSSDESMQDVSTMTRNRSRFSSQTLTKLFFSAVTCLIGKRLWTTNWF